MIDVKVKVNFDELRDLNTRLAKSVIKTASARAVNETAGVSRKIARDKLKRDLRVAATAANKLIYLDRATVSDPTAQLRMARGSMPLGALPNEITEVQTRRGLRLGVRVLIEGNMVFVPGGFFARMKSGKEGIFQRRGRDRLPIREMRVSDVLGGVEWSIFNDDALNSELSNRALTDFPKAFDKHFEAQLSSAKFGPP